MSCAFRWLVCGNNHILIDKKEQVSVEHGLGDGRRPSWELAIFYFLQQGEGVFESRTKVMVIHDDLPVLSMLQIVFEQKQLVPLSNLRGDSILPGAIVHWRKRKAERSDKGKHVGPGGGRRRDEVEITNLVAALVFREVSMSCL